MVRVLDPKHQVCFSLHKPWHLGAHGEEFGSPSFISSCSLWDSPDLLCTPRLHCLCPCSMQRMDILMLATFSDPLWESGHRSVLLLGARTCLRCSAMLPSSLLPSCSLALSPGPVHIFLKVPQHLSFLPSLSDSFPLPQLDASESLLEAEWSGSLSFLPNLSFTSESFLCYSVASPQPCPMVAPWSTSMRQKPES